jgi:hypothetical protein
MRSKRTVVITVLTAGYIFVAPAVAAPDVWDPRLDEVCGLFLDDVSGDVAPGQGYWRLVSAVFEDESESGGNHHIYYKALDAAGSPIENQKTWGSWWYTNETGSAYQFTKGAVDGYWANFGMYANCPGPPENPCGWPYNAWIDTASSPRGYGGPSDKVWGMGMFNPDGTGCGAHVNFRLTWQWTIKPADQPELCLNKTQLAPSAALGTSPASDTFTVRNCGAGTLEYTISDNRSWMWCTPSAGSLTGGTDTITVHYDTAALAGGTYAGAITVAGPDAPNSPQTIGVTLTIEAPPPVQADFDEDGDVDLTDYGFFVSCYGGPGVSPGDPDCAGADFDGDTDVDLADYAGFLDCYNGPQRPPGCD